ncbi:akirin-2 [Protopterus annectens]|uniref:akirin-2 n=1 Tax=Protopterus annectens TaxID=7888 RepID=UPI001CFADCA4|nr:akirin-2 [Protopterus annectens]
MACGATLKRTMDFDPLLSPVSPKRRRCAPLLTPGSSSTSSPQKYLRLEPSPFGEVTARLTTELENNLYRQFRLLWQRRHLEACFKKCDSCCQKMFLTDAIPPVSFTTGCVLGGNSTVVLSPSKKDQPLFTLKQVGMICERLLKEREEKIREEYEEILTSKLAEQYDAFVKFTHDQIMRRYGEQPASCKY